MSNSGRGYLLTPNVLLIPANIDYVIPPSSWGGCFGGKELSKYIQNIVVYYVLDTAMVLGHTGLMVWQEEQTVLKERTKLGRERKEGRREASS